MTNVKVLLRLLPMLTKRTKQMLTETKGVTDIESKHIIEISRVVLNMLDERGLDEGAYEQYLAVSLCCINAAQKTPLKYLTVTDLGEVVVSVNKDFFKEAQEITGE